MCDVIQQRKETEKQQTQSRLTDDFRAAQKTNNPPLSPARHESHQASETQQRHSINSFAQQNLCHPYTLIHTQTHTPGEQTWANDK